MSNIEIISKEQFEKVINSNQPVMIDFFATWCGPCKMLTPILEDVKSEMEEATIYKVDVDESLEIARQYGIMSVPTMIIFKKGEPVEKIMGLRGKEQIIEALNAHL